MDRQLWENPQKDLTLDDAQIPMWFWNDKLKKDELLQQLELQSQVFIKNTMPHARLNGGEGYIGGYLDKEWFNNFQTVLDYKKAQGEKIWIYDEVDWPSGTCKKTVTLNEKCREKYLTFSSFEVPAGEPFRAQLKELTGKSLFQLPPETNWAEYALNVFVVDKESGKPYDIWSYFTYLDFGPEFEFMGEKDAIAYVVDVHVDAYDRGGKSRVNYLDADATEKFLASTYDVYYEHCKEYFGNTIQAVFNDETRIAYPFAWCDAFPEVFKRRKGYDLTKYLYLLPLEGNKAGRVRCDYFDVLAYLYQTNYFGKIQKWCHEHQIKLYAHLLGEETIYGHARYSGDYLRQNRYLDIPGVDHLGKGIGSMNIKYTACGAHSYGKQLTGVEAFAGCGWDFTFEEYIRMITWLFQQGMQIIINHGFFILSEVNGKTTGLHPSSFSGRDLIGWKKQML